MSTPNFCAWESVREQVASNLRLTAAQLDPAWDNICSHSARRAAAELRSILVIKGYTPAEVAAWDDAFTYSQLLATYFALCSGSALTGFDTKTIEWMDCRPELRQAVALIIGGEAVAPSGDSDVGGIAHGRLAAHDNVLGTPDSDGAWGTTSPDRW
jgi:hypothetical protein